MSNSYFMPSVNHMGPGAAKLVGEEAKMRGLKKALIVTDNFLEKAVAPDVAKYLKDAKVDAVIFGGAQPNPTDKNVHDGVDVFKENKCDCIVSLGGGSSHDCAKGIAFVVGGGGHIRDYEGVNKSKKAGPPLLAINTTAGTASEMTRFCIITNTDTKVKMAIVDWRCTPTVSFNDSEIMKGMPPSLTAATGMDALTHAVEAYVSTVSTPVTDSAALMAIRLISENLRAAVANGQDMQARDAMMYAQFLGGMAFNNAVLGYVHAMAHQLGGFYDLPHGVCNAILLPAVSKFNLIAKMDRFADIAEAMGENLDGLSTRDAADKAIDAIRKLSADIGIPAGLKEIGVKEKDLEVMAKNAMKDACGATNPRCPDLEQVIGIFRDAM
ncbi:iron-containing alcohol dehydrogenase [Anoxynatronum buryatiense]|uniref:Alcohol dehydrogenase n=1 Tax=Anoxynatronum buryatiense TaxID=489973 RepID=A0AA45WXX8_9CLOT|nr:iron-containing alcohol dehydrogenase [Anoxynatronum buryatiense]SMP66534.1 alcohol dehydrogenase [Anoxynatronum buryatiense]